MGPSDILIHLLNFVAPAAFLAVVLPMFGHVAVRRAPSTSALVVQALVVFCCGVVVLTGGLVLYGLDGKMAVYAALVGVSALGQWIAGRYWR